MNAEFNWWLLIVGLVGGAGLLWLVLGDFSRREEELDAEERLRESTWIAEVMGEDGQPVNPATAEEVLRLHQLYLRHSRRLDPLEVADLQAGVEPASDIDHRGSAGGAWPSPTEPRPADPRASDLRATDRRAADARAGADQPPELERAFPFEGPIRRNPLVED